MSCILSDCIGCKQLIHIESNRADGTIKMRCKAYPDGIPADVSAMDKVPGCICANGIGYEQEAV